MSDEEPVEPPSVTTRADKLGATFAKHAHAARVAGSEAETARKYAATETFAKVVHDELKPAFAEVLKPFIEAMPDDHPLKLLVGLAGSPGNVVLDALLDVILFPLAFYGALHQVPAILAENIVNDVNAKHPNIPLAPADLANIVVQGYMVLSQGADQAAYSGINYDRFKLMVDAVGMPPSPQDLFEMYRRGLIPEGESAYQFPSIYAGLAQGHTKDEWIPLFQQLVHTWLTPLDFVRAAVQGQMTQSDAETWAGKTGLDTTTALPGGKTMFSLAFDIAGRPPGPEEAGRMANRGIIPWTGTGAAATTFQQVIAESDVKTKYTAALRALQAYVPPPRMIGGLLEKGGITEAQAKKYWEMGGVPAELTDAYVYEATQEATIKEKDLAKGEVLSAYFDRIVDKPTATELLHLLGYSGQVATYMLDVSDFRRELKALNAEVNRIGGYYMHHKITEVEAQSSLETLGVPTDQVAGLLSIWSVERVVPVRIPTTGQISKAVQYGTLSTGEALAKLELLGYTAYDAAIVLSAESEQQIKPLPAQTTTPPVPVV